MFRKDLIDLLLDRPMTVSQIARLVGERPKDVADDLEHLLRSLKHMEFAAVITPAVCRKCGFEFATSRLTKPSRCPECHSIWLKEPKILIQRKK